MWLSCTMYAEIESTVHSGGDDQILFKIKIIHKRKHLVTHAFQSFQILETTQQLELKITLSSNKNLWGKVLHRTIFTKFSMRLSVEKTSASILPNDPTLTSYFLTVGNLHFEWKKTALQCIFFWSTHNLSLLQMYPFSNVISLMCTHF